MKIQKILGILIVLVMLLNVVTPALAANEVENKESTVSTEKTEELEEKNLEKIENNAEVKALAETEESTEGEDAGEKSKTETKETTEGDGTGKEPDASEGDSKQDEDEDEVVWTDFSKAKFELKKSGAIGAVIEISGVTPTEGSIYHIYLSDDGSAPVADVVGYKDDLALTYDKDSKTFKCIDLEVRNAVELNKDIYVSVSELNAKADEHVILSGKKLTRYVEPKYSDAFFATFMTSDADQIVTNFTHSSENNRKLQIKIGKITDQNILQKIKNQDSAGFADLLKYAKSNAGIYNETLNADKDTSSIEYNAYAGEDTGNKVIQLNGVADKAYYYLYVKTDDENGKYFPNEAVTLALSSNTSDNHWSMFFYGQEDFEWIDFGDGSDNTIATGTIPQTGETAMVAIVIALVSVLGVVGYINYKKYRDVK